MTDTNELAIIKHAFRNRGRRRICQLLADIQTRLRRPCGWAPTLAVIVWKCERLGLRVEWSR